MAKKVKTHVFFVLDASGSMKNIKYETIESVNKQIASIKSSQNDKMEITASLITFNGTPKEIFFQSNIFDVQEISESDYNPEGLTSMVDAVSFALDRARDIGDNSASFLLCIFSDGQDTSSKTALNDLAGRMQKLQTTGRWTFTFIGANQDLGKICKKLNIPKGNTLKYDSHSLGVLAMADTQIKSLGYYFVARSYGTKCTRGFYGSDKDR